VALLSAAARHAPFSDLDKKFIRLFGSHLADRVSSIVLRRQAMALLIGKATHDALTGLLNRGAILERLTAQWALSARTGQPLSVLLADIDHFKRINDHHGHQAGDEVLCEVSRRLQARCATATAWAATVARSSWRCCTRAAQKKPGPPPSASAVRLPTAELAAGAQAPPGDDHQRGHRQP
jgi:hypothetical protein